ncbi:MASE1 domain-containing protein [Humisphaera borealis]|uniref:histidine kinase n=1 Tax=Humisphaera borealis TaxID=2807512 RepID=A0A7M2X2K6_9BACT|nr:MASE1 domain-containing protein [Humisphaera borealis]QOV91953.1 MASE1 domain-containing protein [Humisphaera borealis]
MPPHPVSLNDRCERRSELLSRPSLGLLGLFFLAYVSAAGFTKLVAIVPGTGISIWPASGLYIATLILAPRRTWPWWISAAVLAETAGNLLWFHNTVAVATLFCLGNALEAITGAALMRRFSKGPPRLETLREVLTLVALAAGVAPVVTATIGGATLAWVEGQSFTSAWLLLWIGDATGVLIVTPLALVLLQNWRERAALSKARTIEASVLGLVLIGVAILAVSHQLPFAYIIMPPLLWAAVRFEFKGAVVTLVILAAITTGFTVAGVSQFAGDPESLRHKQVMLQLFLVISALSALVVAAISRQHQMALSTLKAANNELENRVLERTATLRDSEARLREREHFLERVTEIMPGVLHVFDLQENRSVFINRTVGMLLGYEPADIAAMGSQIVPSLMHPDDLPRFEKHLARVRQLADGEVADFEMRMRDTSGNWHWFNNRDAVFLRDEAGKVRQLIGTAMDVTEQKRSETALRESENRMRLAKAELQSITDNIPDVIARFDRSLRHVFVSAAIERMTGMPPESHIGRTNRELGMPGALCDRWDGALNAAFETGEPQHLSFAFDMPGGEQRRLESRIVSEPALTGQTQTVLVIVRDVTTAWSTAEELARAKNAAESANAAKDQFLAVLSHELRTPLAPVRMAVSIWERRADVLPPEFLSDLTMIRRNVDLECRLIDDMLDLSRIARGKLELQLAPVDVHAELQHAVRTVDADAAEKQISLTFSPEAARCRINGDSARLQQVFWNLLKNAVKFTPVGGSVAVRTYDRPDGEVAVEVRDNGTGIEPELIGRIFDAFEQGGAGVTRQFGGLGLGLAISKVLAEMHGGTLTAQSDGKGRGATFTLTLKCAAPAITATPSTPIEASDVVAPHSPENPSILLVEDHKDTALVMRRLLRTFGYQVQMAHTVAEAIDLSRRHAFDLVISDLGLPDGTGYELMRQMSADRPTKAIALSGYGMEEDVREGIAAGFAAHLTKPINVEQLERTIRRIIGQEVSV